MKIIILSVFPGLAEIAAEELRDVCKLNSDYTGRVRNNELLTTGTKGDVRRFLELRTVEDVFIELDRVKLTGKVLDLRKLGSMVAGTVSEAISCYERVHDRPGRARQGFRVVVQADDARWRGYRRIDMQEAVERAVMRSQPGLRVMPNATLEIWLWQVGRELIAGLRLTTAMHRTRGGRETERVAALRPTIAAAMVRLAGGGDDDVFLDPMCGTGTILLERAVAGRYGLLVGGDIDPLAVEAVRSNFGPRHQPRRLERWDARHLPLESASVDRVACNLPWGREVAAGQDLESLYREVLTEMTRVVRPSGRMVLLTSEWEVLKRCLKEHVELEQVRVVRDVEVLGRRADIFVIDRGGA